MVVSSLDLGVLGVVHLREGGHQVEDEVGDFGDVAVSEFLADAVRNSGTDDERVVDRLGLEDLLERSVGLCFNFRPFKVIQKNFYS